MKPSLQANNFFKSSGVYIATTFFLVLLLFCTGCTSTQTSENVVNLGGEVELKLLSSETFKSVDKSMVDAYNSVFNNTKIQIPLMRCIEGNGYLMHLGLPINTDFERLKKDRLNHIGSIKPILNEADNYFSVRYKRDSSFICESIYLAGTKSLIYLNYISKDSLIIDSIFIVDSKVNRLNINK